MKILMDLGDWPRSWATPDPWGGGEEGMSKGSGGIRISVNQKLIGSTTLGTFVWSEAIYSEARMMGFFLFWSRIGEAYELFRWSRLVSFDQQTGLPVVLFTKCVL